MKPTQARESGQATLELLVILPLVLAMIALVLMAGWWSYCKLAAQNAAYSYAAAIPVRRPDSAGRGPYGDFGAQYTVLASDEGMKPMWQFTLPHPYASAAYAQSRLGGSGLTAGISPEGWSLGAVRQLRETLGQDRPARTVPRATALFLYTPLLGARQP